ncbi:MAG: hypothetical protein JWO63_3035 [Frankiales bacterium]|nr:hypothetical protein [Frankiales bacterium]
MSTMNRLRRRGLALWSVLAAAAAALTAAAGAGFGLSFTELTERSARPPAPRRVVHHRVARHPLTH